MKNIYLPSLELYLPYEVNIHYKRPIYHSMAYISSSDKAVEYLRHFIDTDTLDHKEYFWVLLLNRANRLLAISEIGKGSDVGVVINHKEIFQLILRTNANSFIVAHNHPSGQLKISQADKKETQKLLKMSEILNFNFLDHIVITSESHYSFTDNKQMS